MIISSKHLVVSSKGKIIFLVIIFLATYYLLLTTNIHAQSQNCSGGSTETRAEGLVTTPALSGIFNTSSGRCITNEQRASFVSFKIPSYEDLKSIYYTQPKPPSTATKHAPVASLSDLENSKIDVGGAVDHIYYFTGDLNITSPSDFSGNNTGIIFIDKNLNFGPSLPSNKFKQGNKDSGIVFVVGGDVVIDANLTEIDAVIIASGTIYTAGSGCATSSVQTAKPLVINGSLVSLNDTKPIKFCRKLADNSKAAEKINWDPKYLAILKDIFADSLQKWSEIP